MSYYENNMEYDEVEYDEDEESPPEDDQNAKYPAIHVRLVGEDGNSFAILGRVKKALQRNGVPTEVIDQFLKEATSGGPDHLIYTCTLWVTVE